MARIDYYVGYPILAVATPHKQKKEGNWKYAILLEGGSEIRIYNERSKIPKEHEIAGEGKFIMAVTNYASGVVEVVIGEPNPIPREAPIEVHRFKLGQAEYSVIDGSAPEIEWFAADHLPQAELPPDPSPERAATEPQERSEDDESAEVGQDA
jgi:hypothetical protein